MARLARLTFRTAPTTSTVGRESFLTSRDSTAWPFSEPAMRTYSTTHDCSNRLLRGIPRPRSQQQVEVVHTDVELVQQAEDEYEGEPWDEPKCGQEV